MDLGALPGRVVERRRIPKLDVTLITATVLLLTAGLMALYSVAMVRDMGLFRRQVVNMVIGLIPLCLFATVHPRFWQRAAVPLYVVNVLMLLAVRFLGKEVKGAERWIDIGPLQFQPSEASKLLIVLTLAAFYAGRMDRMERPSTFGLGLMHVLIPASLILLQPHLGAFMVVMVAWFAITLVANVPLRTLGITALAVGILAGAVLTVPPVRNLVLNDYQVNRVEGLLQRNDSNTRRGKNWQTDRAQIAFGVGGVSGTGFGNGQQKTGRFIPEQQNDFIFTVVGEEGGLVGCTLVLVCFAFFFYRVFHIMHMAAEPFYRMVAAGIFAVLGFHTFVNIAMVLHIVPVVGLWLPFFSAGGTALWLCMAYVGLLLGIRMHEKPLLF